MNIKPIETRYAGYRFRSRLEARWAVFFDAMRVQWKYEPEGYVLPCGTPYLPDFFVQLPIKPQGWGYWIEVKAVRPTDREISMFHSLCAATRHKGFMLYGLPGENGPLIGSPDRVYDSVDRSIEFANDSGLPDAKDYWIKECSRDLPFFPAVWGIGIASRAHRDAEYEAAAQAAKSARFEHGEKPFRTPSG